MTKETQEKWEEFIKSIKNDPIDYQNYGLLAEHCWLFLTNDRMPERASLSKEAFLHEVKAMIETAVWFNTKEISIGFMKWYGVKMMGFIIYLKEVKPNVTSSEIEEKMKEFEGKTYEELFNIYLKEKEQ